MSNVTIDTTFEVGFTLPHSLCTQAPPQPPPQGGINTLTYVGGRSPETWRLIFDLDDAEEVAATFEELARKIRAHVAGP